MAAPSILIHVNIITPLSEWQRAMSMLSAGVLPPCIPGQPSDPPLCSVLSQLLQMFYRQQDEIRRLRELVTQREVQAKQLELEIRNLRMSSPRLWAESSVLLALRDTSRLHEEVQNQTTGPPRIATVSIFFTRNETLGRWKIPVGPAADFPFAFLKQWCLNWLFLDDILPSVYLFWRVHNNFSRGKQCCTKLELEGPRKWSCLWFSSCGS